MSSPWNVYFSFTCWHIWKWRCKCFFDCNFNLPHDMKTIISSYMTDWANASSTILKNNPKQTVMLHWTKPPDGIMKINVDGSLNARGHICAGGIMRDCSGAWCGGFMINLGTGDILLAEIWAMFYGLQLAINSGFQHFVMESNFATLIKLITVEGASVHPLGTVILNCQALAGNLSSFSFKHIHRQENFAADFLAKASLGHDKGITWLTDAPYPMAGIILDDIAGVPKSRRLPSAVPFCSSNPFNRNTHTEYVDVAAQTSSHGSTEVPHHPSSHCAPSIMQPNPQSATILSCPSETVDTGTMQSY